tara:strand:- start:1 stop:231 length:231 start_codon:yes stop_codon:yes gene_type:complete
MNMCVTNCTGRNSEDAGKYRPSQSVMSIPNVVRIEVMPKKNNPLIMRRFFTIVGIKLKLRCTIIKVILNPQEPILE